MSKQEAREYIQAKIKEAQKGPYYCDLAGLHLEHLPQNPCEICPLWDGEGDEILRAMTLGWKDHE